MAGIYLKISKAIIAAYAPIIIRASLTLPAFETSMKLFIKTIFLITNKKIFNGFRGIRFQKNSKVLEGYFFEERSL
jgi:hypothetical protein